MFPERSRRPVTRQPIRQNRQRPPMEMFPRRRPAQQMKSIQNLYQNENQSPNLVESVQSRMEGMDIGKIMGTMQQMQAVYSQVSPLIRLFTNR